MVYSNPSDSDRIRLDKEHRAMTEVARECGADEAYIRRLHAATLSDLARAAATERPDVIHFSGHGSEDGLCLESEGMGDGSDVVDPTRLRAALADVSPGPRLAVFLACFSADSADELVAIAPYVIVVAGTARDDACISFSSAFYREYLVSRSVERAFRIASNRLTYGQQAPYLKPLLLRRALHKPLSKLYPAPVRADTVLLDLTAVEAALQSEGLYNDEFLWELTRKLRVHKWIFDQPRDRTILALGAFFGEFSWTSADDPIRCLRLMRFKDGAEEDSCELWTRLLMTYNELAASSYRAESNPAAPHMGRVLERSIIEQQGLAAHFLAKGDGGPFRRLVPTQFLTTKSLVIANLHQAEAAFHRGDYSLVVSYLEASLTCVHDLVDAVSKELTIAVGNSGRA